MAFKSVDGVETRKVLLTLDEDTIETFREAGGGNVSLGARRVAEAHRGAGTGLQSTAKPARSKPKKPKWQITMEQQSLSYDGKYWFKDGARLSPFAAVKLKREFPELADAEN